MATPKKPSKAVPKAVKSLPKKTGKSAIDVKGGAIRRAQVRVAGGDDDLEDLEVER